MLAAQTALSLLELQYALVTQGIYGGTAHCSVQLTTKDIVRVRNRMAWHFLKNTTASHLLFVDADVAFKTRCVAGMLAGDVGFVAASYPQRGKIDWARIEAGVKAGFKGPLEALAYTYHLQPLDSTPVTPGNVSDAGLVEVGAMPFGLALLRREELQAVADREHCRYADAHYDARGEAIAPTVPNLFGLLLREKGEDGEYRGLLSEDYSFCWRWRAAGHKVYMYAGPGAPIMHIGSIEHRGHIEAFGMSRAEEE